MKEIIDVGYDIGADTVLVSSKNHKLKIGFNEDQPVIMFGNVSVVYDREHLAKMLWAAAYLVDSGEKWKEDDYVGRDYQEDITIN